MERLTKRNEYGDAYYPYCFMENTCDGIGTSGQCNYCDFSTKICEKLAYYEDLEEQGLLLKLPCKVGDELYSVCERANGEHEVITFKLYGIMDVLRCKEHIGKGMYLTKAEAEKALAEMEK